MQALMQVRKAGINAELFPDSAKMKKQMAYANSKQVPFVAIVGESELQEQKLTLKDMNSGEQRLVTPSELVDILQA
jgi:histidyl-tRNA synthetase